MYSRTLHTSCSTVYPAWCGLFPTCSHALGASCPMCFSVLGAVVPNVPRVPPDLIPCVARILHTVVLYVLVTNPLWCLTCLVPCLLLCLTCLLPCAFSYHRALRPMCLHTLWALFSYVPLVLHTLRTLCANITFRALEFPCLTLLCFGLFPTWDFFGGKFSQFRIDLPCQQCFKLMISIN